MARQHDIEPDTDETAPPPLPGLTPRALEVYATLAEQLQTKGIVGQLDQIALSETAQITADLEVCRDVLAAEGRTQMNPKTFEIRHHPLASQENQLRGQLYKFLGQLGLTPRSRPGVPQSSGEKDPLAALLGDA